MLIARRISENSRILIYLWLSRIPGPLGQVRVIGSTWKASKKSQWRSHESGEKPGSMGPDKFDSSDFFTLVIFDELSTRFIWSMKTKNPVYPRSDSR